MIIVNVEVIQCYVDSGFQYFGLVSQGINTGGICIRSFWKHGVVREGKSQFLCLLHLNVVCTGFCMLYCIQNKRMPQLTGVVLEM